MPRMLVKTADWDMWTDRDEEDVRLLDWGLAFPAGQAVTTLPQPIDLRSPETFFCASIDFRHDLWRAGCVVRLFSHASFGAVYRHLSVWNLTNLFSTDLRFVFSAVAISIRPRQ